MLRLKFGTTDFEQLKYQLDETNTSKKQKNYKMQKNQADNIIRS